MSISNLLKAKSEFRKKGVTLIADKVKSGGGGSWKFASEDNLVKTVQAPLSECGLELIVSMNYLSELSTDTVTATLYHVESGENISSQISLPEVKPKADKNGNPLYLDAEIERGKQFGYWSRILSIRLLGLSDIDPEDIKNIPDDLTIEPRDTIKEMKDIKDTVDLLDKESISEAISKMRELFAVEVDSKNKEKLKAYAIKLKAKQEELK